MRIAVLGASPKAERYSNRAVSLLKEKGYEVLPINPAHATICGLTVYRKIEELTPSSVDTVTVYLSPERSNSLGDAIVDLKPRRVIFNPGTENEALAEKLQASGIDVVEGCTLVMLGTDQF